MTRIPARPLRTTIAPSTRRELLRRSLVGASALAASPLLASCGDDPIVRNLGNLGPLGEPDENGLRLPPGFTSRVVATSGETVAGTDYVWPGSPDGGATFATD